MFDSQFEGTDYIMLGQAWWRECEAAGLIGATIRKQGEVTTDNWWLSLSLLLSTMGYATQNQVGSSPLVSLSRRSLTDNAEFVFHVVLDPFKLTTMHVSLP